MTFLNEWTWFILGAALLALEFVAPGSFFMWFAFASFGVGIIGLVIDTSWQAELLLFSLFSLVSLAVWWKWFRNRAEESDKPYLNERGRKLIGQSFTLEEPIKDGHGTIHVLDTVWRVRGPDLAVGNVVTVTDIDGAALIVVAKEA